jgi:hypothetical protein
VKCGVKFCGGCNPRYQRGDGLNKLKEHFNGRIEFVHAQEGVPYDLFLVISGCVNRCASYNHYLSQSGYILMWDGNQIEKTIQELEQMIKIEE